MFVISINKILYVEKVTDSVRRILYGGGGNPGMGLNERRTLGVVTGIVYKDENADKHRKKNSDSYGMIPLKADWTVRAGYHGVCLWGNYTLTNMFKKSKSPELHPYTIGVGFTF